MILHLGEKNMNKYITSPIYYVNGDPHVGHAHTSVMCDILKRCYLMLGHEVYCTTGVDEHGQKNQKAIEDSGLETQVYLDQQSKKFYNLFKSLNVGFDYFVRTTKSFHINAVKKVLNELHGKQLIVKKKYNGYYCEGCEQFKLPRDLDEDGNCPDHNKPPLETFEDNYFFRISKYQDWLIDFINTNPDWIKPDFYRVQVLNMLKEPLEDFCISRPKERVWHGIEFPFDNEYVTYVWFDALINYISNIGYPADMLRFNKWWPGSIHVMAKDIIKTHCIYWPIILKALDLEPQNRCFIHGYWVGEGGLKMSKSLGNAIDPNKAIELIGREAFRYYMSVTMGKSEAQMSYSLMKETYNRDLANNLGNTFYRTAKLVNKYFDGVIPDIAKFENDDLSLVNGIADTANSFFMKGNDILEINYLANKITEMGRAINIHIDTKAPWNMMKEGNAEDKLSSVLYSCLDALRIIFEFAYPIMPEISMEVLNRLGLAYDFDTRNTHKFQAGLLPRGHKLKKVEPLFLRID